MLCGRTGRAASYRPMCCALITAADPSWASVLPFTFILLVYPLFILPSYCVGGGWGRFAIVLTAPLMAEAARFSNLLLSVRCSFFNQSCNLLRPGDINRVTGTLNFDHVALGSFGVPAFEVRIDDSVSCCY